MSVTFVCFDFRSLSFSLGKNAACFTQPLKGVGGEKDISLDAKILYILLDGEEYCNAIRTWPVALW